MRSHADLDTDTAISFVGMSLSEMSLYCVKTAEFIAEIL